MSFKTQMEVVLKEWEEEKRTETFLLPAVPKETV